MRRLILFLIVAALGAACGSLRSNQPSAGQTASNKSATAAEKTPITYSYADKVVRLYDVPGYEEPVVIHTDLPPDVGEKTTFVNILDANGKVSEDKITIEYDQSGLTAITFKGKPVEKKQ